MSRRGHGEGTIVRRADGRWCAAVSLGPGRKRKWLYGKTRREVQEKLTKELHARQLGVAATASPRLGEFLLDWLAQIEGARAEKTMLVYRRVLTLHVIPELGRKRLSDLRVDDVQRLLGRKQREGLTRTAGQAREVLRAALNAAMRRELVGRNVAALAEPPRAAHREAAWLTASQARAFLDAAKGDPLEAFYLVGIGLGLRPSETLGLRWADIDFDQAILRVRVQLLRLPGRPVRLADVKTTRSRRPIPMPEMILTALRTHRTRQAKRELEAKRWQAWGLVFTDDRGAPLQLDAIRRAFYVRLESAGLPRLRLYDATRHSCASMLAAAGIHPSVAQQILGHADIQTTLRIYTHVAPEMVRDGALAIDRALGPI